MAVFSAFIAARTGENFFPHRQMRHGALQTWHVAAPAGSFPGVACHRGINCVPGHQCLSHQGVLRTRLRVRKRQVFKIHLTDSGLSLLWNSNALTKIAYVLWLKDVFLPGR
jgi:hypothetical protein